MALTERIFCMMVLAMFSYNSRHSGGVLVFTPENLRSQKARAARMKRLWFFSNEVRRRSL